MPKFNHAEPQNLHRTDMYWYKHQFWQAKLSALDVHDKPNSNLVFSLSQFVFHMHTR